VDLLKSPNTCDVDWLVANKEMWLKHVVGVGQVVFTKLESLLRVGPDRDNEAFTLAWDSRILALRLGIVIRAHSKQYASKFGFPDWIDWAACGVMWRQAGLFHLVEAANAIAQEQMIRLKYATNSRRSSVAAHLQGMHSGLVNAFCTEHQMQLTATNIHGLREGWRFLHALQGVHPDKYNHTRRHLKRKFVCHRISKEYTGCLFNRLGLDTKSVCITPCGLVYCEMVHVLYPEDTAYWWACPGTMVQLVLPEVVRIELANAPTAHKVGKCELFVGSTADDAYATAAAHCTSFNDLVEKMVAGDLVVAAWAIEPGVAAWGFKVDRIFK
jgi:hypothetical protein